MPAKRTRTKPVAPAKTSAQQGHGLRYAAELAFTMSPGTMSPDILAQKPEFSSLSPGLLRKWVQEGRWDDRRRAHFDTLRQQLRQKMSQDMVQGKARQVADLESLWEQGMVMLEDPRLVPKQGWEGMAQSLLRIGDSLDKTRKNIMREILADVRPEQGSATLPSMGDSLDEEEARAAARAIVMARQKRLRLSGATLGTGGTG